jgi:hypothetical protein
LIQRYCTFEPPKNKQVKWGQETQFYYAQEDTPFEQKLNMLTAASQIIVPVDWLHHDEQKTQVAIADQLDIDIYILQDGELELTEVECVGVLNRPKEVVDEDG